MKISKDLVEIKRRIGCLIDQAYLQGKIDGMKESQKIDKKYMEEKHESQK